MLSSLGTLPEASGSGLHSLSHSERCKEHGLEKLQPLAEWLRFKESVVRRVRFPMETICGARLLILDASRPHGDLPAARGSLPVSSLGKTSSDSYENWRALPGTAAASGPELEPLGLLILELKQLGMSSGADFAEMPVWATHRERRWRRKCVDWTPEMGFSEGRRHYLLGDASEMIELARALSVANPPLGRLLKMEENQEPALKRLKVASTHVDDCVRRMQNSLASDVDHLLPSKTSAVLSLGSLAARKLLSEEAASQKPEKVVRPKLPFESTDEVHDFLRRAGIKEVEGVNLCLKAGMLNGHISIPPELLKAKNTKPFLKQVLYKGACHDCGKSLTCTVRQALFQDIVGFDYEDGGEGGAVQCKSRRGCGIGNYISGLCDGQPHYESGKFHNHCDECPDFGMCIGDYREAHCHRCGEHYFAGCSGLPCPCRGKDLDRHDPFGGFGSEESDSNESFCYEESPIAPNVEISPIVPAGCWNGHLRGVNAKNQHEELRAEAQKLNSQLADHGISSMPLSKLATFVDQLRPFEPESDLSDEEAEEQNEEDDPVSEWP